MYHYALPLEYHARRLTVTELRESMCESIGYGTHHVTLNYDLDLEFSGWNFEKKKSYDGNRMVDRVGTKGMRVHFLPMFPHTCTIKSYWITPTTAKASANTCRPLLLSWYNKHIHHLHYTFVSSAHSHSQNKNTKTIYSEKTYNFINFPKISIIYHNILRSEFYQWASKAVLYNF